MAKIGVIHYNWPGLSFLDFLDYAAGIGCTHIELMLDDVWPEDALDARPRQLQEAASRVQREVQAHNLRISALGARNDFVQLDEDAIESQVTRMRRVCAMAEVLGDETVVRAEGGVLKDAVPEDRQWEAMRECFARCIPFLDELEVSLAIDNHGLVTNDGDKLAEMLEHLDHPRIGSNLDTMNFRWAGHDVATCNRFYDRLAPHVLHTHFKDGTGTQAEYSGAALGAGEIDLSHALVALKKSGYNGVYCAEYEGKETDGTGYRKCVEWLRKNT
jgi:sugar phosphate isomerase/epimerase